MSMYNSMNSGLENWGLLSVADVEEREVTAKSNTMDRISWVDNPNISLFSKKKQKASQTYVDNLQKSYCESRISNRTTIEEVFSQQFGKLRLALKASEKKLKLQSSAELLDDPAVCPPAHNAILDAIGVLASLSFPAGNNGTIVANCLSLVDWRKASPSSSLEVFNLLVKTFFSQGNCTDSEVMLPMVSLSLKSGYLGPILWCVLHGAEGSVVGQIAPTAIDHCPVTHFKYALDSFTASFCQLPFSTGDEKISCFRFPPKKFCVCRSSTLVDYQVLGKQGSRVSRDREFTLTLQKGERVICRNEKQALTIQSCGYGSYCWRFRLNTFDLRKRSQQDSTPFVVNCTSLSASNFRFHFSIQQDRLICLLSRLSTQRISRSAYVASLPLSEIKQGGKEMVVSEACELKRPSVSTPQGLLRALQFRKGAGISVGHVSLKDEFSPFCVELWVLPSGIDETLTMITMGNKAVEEILLQVSCVSGGLEWRGGVRTPQLGNSFTTVFVPGQLGISRWWHVALNFTGMMWELFVDTQHTASQSAMVSSHGIADAECVLGPNLSGFLREVRVWNTARPINLLKRDWKRTLSGKEDGLIGYFPLNEHQGNVVMDHASGFHAMMGGNTSATWMPVRNVPVSLPENAPAISEFVPFAVAMDPDSVYFVVTACYYCVVSVVSLESLHIYYYGKTSLTLESYSETEIPTSWRVKSVGYNEEKDCIQCCCTVLEDASRLAMWDIHHVSVLQRPEEGITPGTVWEYGRQHLQKYARYAEKVLSADKYLNDQANWWCEKVPTCVLDYSPGVLQRLVELIEKAIHRSDSEMERCGSLLLHCNLFFRFRTNREALRDEVGDQFDTVTAFIDTSVNVEENKRGRSELPLRDRVAGFAFRNHSVLLQACLQCLLEEETKVQFIKSTAARDRGGREDAVFWALLEYCSMLQPLTSLMSSRPTAETFYGALIMESTFQVNQCYRTSDYAALSRVNRCLEAFQEFLFVQTCDTKSDRSTEEQTVLLKYTSTLLHACKKTCDAATAIIRKRPANDDDPLLEAVHRCHVGTLLPSLVLSLPLFPVDVQCTISPLVQSCSESLSALSATSKNPPAWLISLKVAFSFSLAEVGCSLLQVATNNVVSAAGADLQRYHRILRGGFRKGVSDRDNIIKGLIAGSGSLSKGFSALLKKDPSAVRVVRDDRLLKMERCVMAAFCALTVSTADLTSGDPASIEGVYSRVKRMRPNTLSKRQTDEEYIDRLESRAEFLAQFEACVQLNDTVHVNVTRPTSSKAVEYEGKLPEQTKWRLMFRNWKATHLTKQLMSAREESSNEPRVYNLVIEFLESEIDCDELSLEIETRLIKANRRLSGLTLLKELIDEAVVNSSLASLILPSMSRVMCGWCYSEQVDCCPGEDLIHLHSAYFQLWDAVVTKCLEKNVQKPWAMLLASLITPTWTLLDLKRMGRSLFLALCNIWKTYIDPVQATLVRKNGNIPTPQRETLLSSKCCGSSLHVSPNGELLISEKGKSTCVVPLSWSAKGNRATYYFEVLVVELFGTSTCSVGVGPADYSLSRPPGLDPNSYALQCDEGLLFSSNSQPKVTGFSFSKGDVVGCGWDVENRKVYWTRNGKKTASVDITPVEKLSPLLGTDGCVVLKVNFGRETFRYDGFPCRGVRTRTLEAMDLWDPFRILSLRVALRAAEAVNSTHVEGGEKNIGPLTTVGHICCALREELKRAVSALPDSSPYTKGILRHTTSVMRLLTGVSLDDTNSTPFCDLSDVFADLSRRLFLEPTTVSTDGELHQLALYAWFHVVAVLPECPQSRVFFDVLLRLCRSLIVFSLDTTLMNKWVSSNMISTHADELIFWQSLALLQKINATQHHSCTPMLHTFICDTLSKATTFSCDVYVVLAILGGGARLAVPGDQVRINMKQYAEKTVTLTSFSLTEGISTFVDNGRCITLPIHDAQLIVLDCESFYFPNVSSESHITQVKHFAEFAVRVRGNVPADSSTESSPRDARYAQDVQLLSILQRCEERKTISIPMSLLQAVSSDGFQPETLEKFTVNNTRVRQAKVMIEYWRVKAAARAFTASLRGIGSNLSALKRTENNNAANDSFNDFFFPSGYRLFNSRTLEECAFPSVGSNPYEDDFISPPPFEALSSPSLSTSSPSSSSSLSNSHTTLLETLTDASPNGEDSPDGTVVYIGSGGFIQVESEDAVGQCYTVHLQVNVTEVNSHQILLVQPLVRNDKQRVVTELLARIYEKKIEFGFIMSVPGCEKRAVSSTLCYSPCDEESDVGCTIGITLVQDEKALFLYKDGDLQDTRSIDVEQTSFFLNEKLFLCGTPYDPSSSLRGELKGFFLFDSALGPTTVKELHTRQVSSSDPGLCIWMKWEEDDSLANAATSDSKLDVQFAMGGVVSRTSGIEEGFMIEECITEGDFTHDLEDTDLPAPMEHDFAFVSGTAWEQGLTKSSDELLAPYQRCCRHLVYFLRMSIVSNLLKTSSQDAEDPENITCKDVVAGDVVGSVLECATRSSDETVYCNVQQSLEMAVRGTLDTDNTTTLALAEKLIRGCLAVSTLLSKTCVVESAHPFPSLTRSVHEVHVPEGVVYNIYFDPQTKDSNLTFSFNGTVRGNSLQCTSANFLPFQCSFPLMLLEVRSDSSAPQWGYKVYFVYNCEPQLRAIRLFNVALAEVVRTRGGINRIPFLSSTTCLHDLMRCALWNAGKTRRLALQNLSTLMLLISPNEHSQLPPLSDVHDLRRMAEKYYLSFAKGRVVQSRFVQVLTEFYIIFSDAYKCWTQAEDAEASTKDLSVQEERDEFNQRRQRQQALYHRRSDAENVVPRAWSEPQQVELVLTGQGIWTAKTTHKPSPIVIGSPLSEGCWYFEVTMDSASDIFIGVLPVHGAQKKTPLDAISFNGLLGIFANDSEGEWPAIWSNGDNVGVVLDIDRKQCHFIVCGVPSVVSLSLDVDSDFAVAAAGERNDGEAPIAFYPYILLGPNESVSLNFGASYFEYQLPPDCLPLDPFHGMLGTLLPYYQIRTFYEVSAHILTDGVHVLPPFFFDDTDPFAGFPERVGPAHVSLLPRDGVEVEGTTVRNKNERFTTLTANCAVNDGAWYYEVVLKSQGLMQLGWSACTKTLDLVHPTSVGDSPSSWSVDLFRRCCWHKEVAHPVVDMPRRWIIGDVVGCALDLPRGEVSMFLNGKLVRRSSLHAGATFSGVPSNPRIFYVPCVSLRCGNSIDVNFGSSVFSFKPDGFRSLGVSDSWNERMEVFYASERVTSTAHRLGVLRRLYKLLDPDSLDQSKLKHLEGYRSLVKVVDSYCKEHNKNYAQLSAEELKNYTEKTSFGNDALQGRPLHDRFSVLLSFARVAQVVLPFLPLQRSTPGLGARMVLTLRHLLFESLRTSLVDSALEETNQKPENYRVSVNRGRARSAPRSYYTSVFGQTVSLVNDLPPRIFMTNKHFWHTVLLGEGAEDAGGPFREHIGEICRELMLPELKLFVPTGNQTQNTGACRDAFVPAAGANSETQLAAFTFLGKLMGGCMRAEEPMSLVFPPLVWRFLCGVPLTENDLREVDQLTWQAVEEFRRNKASEEEFEAVFDEEYFVARLSDHTVRELIPNGANTKVTYSRSKEYAERLLSARLHEFDEQLLCIREGLVQVIPDFVLLLLTPEELERRVCGKPDYDVEELKKTTIYEGLIAEDRRVALLWTALEEATPLQRRLFLRFVSGRDRLPMRLRLVPLSSQGDPDAVLPKAATCFFALELPDYSSLEVMKTKLFYSIENCADIDTDFEAHVTDIGDNPRLTVGNDTQGDDAPASPNNAST